MIQAGAFVAKLTCSAAALPAHVQDALRVVDALGHQVVTLKPVWGGCMSKQALIRCI